MLNFCSLPPHKPSKSGMYHLQVFCTMNLFRKEDHLCILKTRVVLVLIYVELQMLFFSMQMFDHLGQLFVLNFQDDSIMPNFIKGF